MSHFLQKIPLFYAGTFKCSLCVSITSHYLT
ncbi:hypothetical protein J832_1844, partial [Acinetobacter baumannii 25691_9]